jgi:hypothetical protein
VVILEPEENTAFTAGALPQATHKDRSTKVPHQAPAFAPFVTHETHLELTTVRPAVRGCSWKERHTMGLFSVLFGETTEKKIARWKEELLDALPSLLSKEDDFELSEDQTEVVVRRGSAHISIGFGADEDEEIYLIIYSPLVFMPRDNLLPFYRKLLDLNNAETLLGRLATVGNMVVLRCALPVDGLSDETFGDCIGEMMAEADLLDDLLIEEFSVKRFEFSD